MIMRSNIRLNLELWNMVLRISREDIKYMNVFPLS
jgi:hypothetical protein